VTAEETHLDTAIDRYPPAVASSARAALKKLRKHYPGARLLVFERRRLLAIGIAPSERGGPVFSVVLYPRWVRFFFFEGVALDDPDGRLEGSGNQVRSIRLDEAATALGDPYIRALMLQSVKLAGVSLKSGSGEVVLKSTLAKEPSVRSRSRSVRSR
jgi:hypothetical protein